MGIVGIALTGCASGEQTAEDQAVAEMAGQLTTLQDNAKYSLQSSPDRSRAREYFTRQQSGYVYASSSSNGNAISWSIALVGQGGRSTSGSSTVIRLRSCLTMQSAAALELKLTTVTCPARFTSSSNFDSTDRDFDLLALGKHDSADIRSPSPDVDLPANNEAYRQRFTLPKGIQETAETHRERVTGALQKAVNEGPLDRTGVARVLAPLGYDDSSVEAYGRSDGPGASRSASPLAPGASTAEYEGA